MPNKQTLVIRGKLLTLNEYINAERTNKYRAASLKKGETHRVAWECKIQRLKAVEKFTKAIFTYFHKDKRIDFDNIEFFQKFLWDGLEMARIIPRDTQKYTPRERIHIHKYDKNNPRLEVELYA